MSPAMTIDTMPTRKAEDWRYADMAALEKLWPLAPVEEITVAQGGDYTRAIVQTDGGVTRLAITVEAGAKAAVHVLNAGGYARVELNIVLHEGADFTLGGAQLARAGDVVEIVTTLTHAQGNASSRQLVRSVAAAQGTVSYLGKVRVEQGADGTDGEQSVRAMLLDRTAVANARPELEIYADDVKCAHGCAVGELDAQALFYLAQRGLPPEKAKALMLQAFVAEAFDGADQADHLQSLAAALLEVSL